MRAHSSICEHCINSRHGKKPSASFVSRDPRLPMSYARNRRRRPNVADGITRTRAPKGGRLTGQLTRRFIPSTPFSLSFHGLPPSSPLSSPSQSANGSICGINYNFSFVQPSVLTLRNSLLPARYRLRQTQHDSPNQYRRMALPHSQSNFMKTPSEPFTPKLLPLM
jgi:hypothetical protein